MIYVNLSRKKVYVLHLAPSSGYWCSVTVPEWVSQVVISWEGCVMKASLMCEGWGQIPHNLKYKIEMIFIREFQNQWLNYSLMRCGCVWDFSKVNQVFFLTVILINEKLCLQEMKEFLEWHNCDCVISAVVECNCAFTQELYLTCFSTTSTSTPLHLRGIN